MNKYFVLIIMSLLLCNKINAHDIYFSPNRFEQEVICKLFEGEWTDNENVCKWTPNVSEKWQFGVDISNNYVFYTKLDTVFHFEADGTKYIMIITATYTLGNDGVFESCHVCAPVLSFIQLRYDNVDGAYKLDCFVKFMEKIGAWGKPPEDIKLVQFGKDLYCIKIVNVFSNDGTSEEYTSLYYKGKNILSFPSSESNINSLSEDSYEYKTEMRVDKETKTVIVNSININYKGRDINDNPIKDKTTNGIVRYAYNEGLERFEETCH